MALIRCLECNSEVSDKAVSCPKCAFPLAPQLSTQRVEALPEALKINTSEKYIPKKSSGVAVLLSVLWTGLGQIYNGQIGKGLGMAAAYPLSMLWGIFTGGAINGFFGYYSKEHRLWSSLIPSVIAGIAIVASLVLAAGPVCALWIFGMVDAHKTAVKINIGEMEE